MKAIIYWFIVVVVTVVLLMFMTYVSLGKLATFPSKVNKIKNHQPPPAAPAESFYPYSSQENSAFMAQYY